MPFAPFVFPKSVARFLSDLLEGWLLRQDQPVSSSECYRLPPHLRLLVWANP